MLLKPKGCYGGTEVLDLLFLGSAVGSFVHNDLLPSKSSLEWAELSRLWWGGCCSLPQFRESCLWKIICQGGAGSQMAARATTLSHHSSPLGFHSLLLLLNINSESEAAAGLGLLLLSRWKTSHPFFVVVVQINFRAVLLALSGLTEIKSQSYPLEVKHASWKASSDFPKFHLKYLSSDLISFLLASPCRNSSFWSGSSTHTKFCAQTVNFSEEKSIIASNE